MSDDARACLLDAIMSIVEDGQLYGRQFSEVRARIRRVLEAPAGCDNGNLFVFCDYVDAKYGGCIRGAGHNGQHIACQSEYPTTFGPVVGVGAPPPARGETA